MDLGTLGAWHLYPAMPDKDLASGLSHLLLPQVQQLIDAARGRAASAVNAELTLLYWQIGKLLKEYVVQTERAPYGQEVMKGLAAKLTEKYGKGWSHQQLRHCLHTAETIELESSKAADLPR